MGESWETWNLALCYICQYIFESFCMHFRYSVIMLFRKIVPPFTLTNFLFGNRAIFSSDHENRRLQKEPSFLDEIVITDLWVQHNWQTRDHIWSRIILSRRLWIQRYSCSENINLTQLKLKLILGLSWKQFKIFLFDLLYTEINAKGSVTSICTKKKKKHCIMLRKELQNFHKSYIINELVCR